VLTVSIIPRLFIYMFAFFIHRWSRLKTMAWNQSIRMHSNTLVGWFWRKWAYNPWYHWSMQKLLCAEWKSESKRFNSASLAKI
jgi:uncharacterized Fe-S cluster-containing MiaB family protein